GMRLLTVTLKRATSLARLRAKPVTAARKLLESINPSIGCFTAIDVTLRIRPHRRSFIPGSTARASPTALKSSRRVADSHDPAVKLSNAPLGGRSEERRVGKKCREPYKKDATKKRARQQDIAVKAVFVARTVH